MTADRLGKLTTCPNRPPRNPGRFKGNAGKAEMIAAAKARGITPVDDNHADALALLDWAMTQGGVA